ncbi:MAG: NADH:flavin oxidoreductase [Rhizobiales bacterium]|nr:NADH:flavin oxidoreductase [Hyphomicrobiales bacterium]
MKLFEPLNIAGMAIPNRIMVPAMVTRLSGDDGFVNQDIRERYVRYAQGGVGLIVVEAMAVHDAKSGPLLRISDDKYIPGLADLVRRIHDSSDAKVVPQIIHFLKVAKSGWRQTVDMLSHVDIDRIVEEFGNAVVRARQAGFDGAELHSAHAYTLASFLSRTNPRTDEYGGQALEGRLQLIGRIFETIRKKTGGDFPVGVRFLADEFIKDGYTVCDAKVIGLRLAELGAAYLSLSVGGKFEDAIHVPGHVPYPYTGYSGDRCMPGNWYPNVPHAHFSAEIKSYLTSHGYNTPVATTGKISEPDDAERLVAAGQVDIIGIARGLLADPDWPNKVRDGERERIIRCDYCNVCKHLDGTHNRVICSLWPQGALQAPIDIRSADAPKWNSDGAALRVLTAGNGIVALKWNKSAAASRYDVHRCDEQGNVSIEDAVKVTRWEDHNVLSGKRYRYYVKPYAATGQPGVPSNTVFVDLPPPSYMTPSMTAATIG